MDFTTYHWHSSAASAVIAEMTTWFQEIFCWIKLDNILKVLISKEENMENLTNNIPPPSIKGVIMPIPEGLAESLEY